jgi:hypothetical protein
MEGFMKIFVFVLLIVFVMTAGVGMALAAEDAGLEVSVANAYAYGFDGVIEVTLSAAGRDQYVFRFAAANYTRAVPLWESVAGGIRYNVSAMFLPCSANCDDCRVEYVLIDRSTALPVRDIFVGDGGAVVYWAFLLDGDSYTGGDMLGSSGSGLGLSGSDEHEPHGGGDDDFIGELRTLRDSEGDLLFARYYALMKHSDMNDEFAMFYIDVADEGIARIRDLFLLYTEKTLDDWFAMTWLERHIYRKTYLLIYEHEAFDSFHRYFASEQLFLENTVSTTGYRQNFDEAVFDAYIDLMLWQYHYFINNGVPYNFLTGFVWEDLELDSIDMSSSSGAGRYVSGNGNAVPFLDNLLGYDADSAEEQTQHSVWARLLDGLKNSWFTILLLLIGAGVGLYIYLYRRSLSIRSDDLD